jgi:hypothetical protein
MGTLIAILSVIFLFATIVVNVIALILLSLLLIFYYVSSIVLGIVGWVAIVYGAIK